MFTLYRGPSSNHSILACSGALMCKLSMMKNSCPNLAAASMPTESLPKCLTQCWLSQAAIGPSQDFSPTGCRLHPSVALNHQALLHLTAAHVTDTGNAKATVFLGNLPTTVHARAEMCTLLFSQTDLCTRLDIELMRARISGGGVELADYKMDLQG